MVMQQLMTFVQYTAVSKPVIRNSAYACLFRLICVLNSTLYLDYLHLCACLISWNTTKSGLLFLYATPIFH